MVWGVPLWEFLQSESEKVMHRSGSEKQLTWILPRGYVALWEHSRHGNPILQTSLWF
jgi:hypothetical protein